MDLASFQGLLTPAGQEILQAARELQPQEVDFLRHFTALSRSYPSVLARAALEIAILRGEAASKFPFAGKLYFTREALEQSTAWEVALHRAERYQPFEQVLDLGCSIGGDSFALAGASAVLGLDLDPLRLHMARANLRALGLDHKVSLAQADLAFSLPALPLSGRSQAAALFFDPARRANRRRATSVREYQPPLALVKTWLPDFPALGVKISPGVELAELAGYSAEVEFVSLRGELKEAVLWFGPLHTADRRATLLPGGHTLSSGEIESAAQPDRLPILPPQAYIYEPDPAILRAGLVQHLGRRLEAAQLDADIAYMTAEKLQPTPFARVWAVEDWMPYGLKRLRAYLRQRGVGRVTVKKRGSPLEPEALIHDLRLTGEAEKMLFLTHLQGKPVVIVAHPLPD